MAKEPAITAGLPAGYCLRHSKSTDRRRPQDGWFWVKLEQGAALIAGRFLTEQAARQHCLAYARQQH